MAFSDYAIPWKPLDLGPGIEMLLAARKQKADARRSDANEATLRLNADINLRRLNSEEARKSFEMAEAQREKERLRKIEQAQALEHVQQLARTSPGLARGYGDAFGISLEEKPQVPAAPGPVNPLLAAVSPPTSAPDAVPAPVEAPPQAPDPDAVDAVSGGGDIPPDRMVKLGATDESPFTITADVPKPPQAQVTPQPMAAAAAQAGPLHPLYQAVIGGQRYDLDTQMQPTGLGPKYDALYNRFLQEPGGEKTAFAKVLAAWEQEQSQNASAQRTADLIKGRGDLADKFRLTAEQQEQLRRDQMAQSEKNARIGAASRVAAAGTEKPSAADSAEARAQTAFLADFKDFRDRTAAAAKEVQSTRNLAEIQHLANSNNPVDQALAVEQIGKIAHGGNTVTKATQDLIYHHMGGAFERGEAALKQFTDHGRMADAQLQMLRNTARDLAKHHDENNRQIQQGFELQFGPNSAYGSPYMQPLVRQHLNALYAEIGAKPPADASAPQTEESIRLGRRRGGMTGATGHAPAGPAPGIPPGSREVPGRLGPNHRQAWLAPDGSLHEQDR